MKKHPVAFVLGMVLFLFAGAAYAAGQVLTIADVEKVSRIKGLKLIPKDPTIGAGGDLNFAKADGKLVLIVVTGDKALLAEMKAQKGNFNAPVGGIGDEAYDGPGFGKVRYVLAFRKGNKMASISSFMDMDAGGKPFFTQAQLKELAKTALSKM